MIIVMWADPDHLVESLEKIYKFGWQDKRLIVSSTANRLRNAYVYSVFLNTPK